MPHLARAIEIAALAVSVAMFVGSLAAVPWIIRRLPADHFVRPPKRHSLATRILRNSVGAALCALGVAMLVLPGQGVLTILIGLSILDIEAKKRAIHWLLRKEKIQRGVQHLRAKAGRPPLIIPERSVIA